MVSLDKYILAGFGMFPESQFDIGTIESAYRVATTVAIQDLDIRKIIIDHSLDQN